MNEFLSKSWIEGIERLALGLEPIDAARGARITQPLSVIFNEQARGLRRPPVERHESCLHVLLYHPGLADRVALRFLEESPISFSGLNSYPRRFVPRLISYPILTRAQAETLDYRNRVRRPAVFPGAAHDLASGVTGIRGRVERAGVAVRWARVVATIPDNDTVVGRAHGDDRGEFLLLISSLASPAGELVEPLPVRVDVFGPAVAPVPSPASLAAKDPFWDLPSEQASVLDPNIPDVDPVSAGETLPTGHSATTGRTVQLTLGSIHSEAAPFTIP